MFDWVEKQKYRSSRTDSTLFDYYEKRPSVEVHTQKDTQTHTETDENVW